MSDRESLFAPSVHVEITVDGKVVWKATYKDTVNVADSWEWGYPPREATRKTGRAIRRAGRRGRKSAEAEVKRLHTWVDSGGVVVAPMNIKPSTGPPTPGGPPGFPLDPDTNEYERKEEIRTPRRAATDKEKT